MIKTIIARKFGMVRQTVSGIVAQFSERQMVVLAPKPGKPWKTDDQNLCQLGKLLEANPQMKMASVKDLMDTLSTRW
jgi:hypothetical protein